MKPVTLLALALLSVPAGAQATPTADYTVLFEASWSAQTHPTSFPPGPHFSGLVGGTHDAGVHFWEPGGLASTGIERMAEVGIKTQLIDEVEAAITAGTAADVLSGGAIGLSPGSVALNFTVAVDHPLVTLVSMIAPSPDWFVGVDGLTLLEDGDWVPCRVVELYGWDAGTDSGNNYTSANADTNPAEPISPLGAPLSPGVPVGRFVFTRTDAPPVDAFVDLGQGLAGSGGSAPVLTASGTLCDGSPLTVDLDGAPAGVPTYFCIGVQELGLPFHGGVLVPDITSAPGLFVVLPTDGTGAVHVAETWPLGVGGGLPLYLQFWTPDAGAPLGFSASNAVRGETP